MQYDVLALRAVEALPSLLAALDGSADPRTRRVVALLGAWDCRMDADSPAAAVFEVFFARWTDAVVAERFSSELAAGAAGDASAFLALGTAGLALAVLQADEVGWFEAGNREAAIHSAFQAALDELAERVGPDPESWQWGRLHRVRLRHPLSGRGELGELLDRADEPVSGSGSTVGNTGSAPDYRSAGGANYRLLSDLAETPPRLWTVDVSGQSGHPGSPHYCDRLAGWLAGDYQPLTLDPEAARAEATTVLTIEP
jgi:penicillin amidase